jgi:hypothetical protein
MTDLSLVLSLVTVAGVLWLLVAVARLYWRTRRRR